MKMKMKRGLTWFNRYKISSADISIRCDATIDDLIDVLEAKNRSYIPAIYVLNKIDSISIEELDLLYRIPNSVPISSEHGWNIDELLEVMYGRRPFAHLALLHSWLLTSRRWEKLNLVRVYTKPKGKMPDYSAPVVLRANKCTVEDFVSLLSTQTLLKITHEVLIRLSSVTKSIRASSSSSRWPLSMASRSSTSRNELASLMN